MLLNRHMVLFFFQAVRFCLTSLGPHLWLTGMRRPCISIAGFFLYKFGAFLDLMNHICWCFSK